MQNAMNYFNPFAVHWILDENEKKKQDWMKRKNEIKSESHKRHKPTNIEQ